MTRPFLLSLVATASLVGLAGGFRVTGGPSSPLRWRGLRFSSLSDAVAAMDAGELERAEALLIEARASDPHRDMPKRLHEAFCRLFREHAAADPAAVWPLEGTAALHADQEEHEAVLDACREAQRRGALTPAMRMRRFHAARASFQWHGDVRIDEEAVELASYAGAATVVPPFTALSMPLAPDVLARIAKAYLERSIERSIAANASLPPPPPAPRPGEPLVVAFITPDANGAHPLGQLMAGTFRHFSKHDVKLFSMCRDDGSPSRADFVVGTSAVVDVTAWRPADIAAEVRRQGVHVLVDLCGVSSTGVSVYLSAWAGTD